MGGFGSIVIGAIPDLPASGHGRASGFIADGEASDPIDFLDDLEHAMQETVLFDNCQTTISNRDATGTEGVSRRLTLMSQPFPQLNVLGTGTQSQEVPLHVQRGIFLLEEVLGSFGVIRERAVHVRGERCGVGHGTRLGCLGNW